MDKELQKIVERMVAAGESESNIALVIQNYKKKSLSSPPQEKPLENIVAPLNNGGAAISQSPSNSISPFDLAGNIAKSNPTDEVFKAKIKGEQNISQQQAATADKATENFNKVIVPFARKAEETITLQDGTKIDAAKITPRGGLLDNNNNAQEALLLQQKVNTNTLTDDDLATLGSGAGMIPELVKAKVKNDPLDIAVATFKNEKTKFDESLKQSIEQANLRFGLKDTYDYITSTPEATKEYLSRITALKDGDTERLQEKRNMSSMQAGDVRNFTKNNETDKEQGDLEGIVSQATYFAKNKAIEKIALDGNLTREQKLKKTLEIIDDRAFKNAKEALANEKQPTMVDNILKGATISGIAQFLTEDTDYDRKENKDALNSFTGTARLALSNKTNQYYQQEKLQIAKDKRNLAEKTASQVDGGVFVQEEADIKNREDKLKEVALGIESSESLLNEYPSLRKQQVASLINDYKAQTSGNLDNETSNTTDEQKALKAIGLNAYLKSKNVDLDNQIVQDAIDEDKTKSYSWFGGTGKAFADVFRSTRKSIGDLIGARDDISVLGEKRLDELFPRAISKTDEFQLNTGTGITQNIGQTSAQVLGQAALQYATAGLGRLAGAAKVAATVGSWSGGILTSYDDAYKQAYDFTDTQLGRSTYAGLIAIANGASEKIFNDQKLIEAIPGVKQGYSEIARRFGTVGFTDAMANDILKQTQKSIINYAKGYGENIGQEVVEEVSTQAFTDATRYLYGDKTVTLGNALDNIKETAIQTATGMIGIGAMGVHADVRLRRNTSDAGTLYNAALYKDEATLAIEKGFREGVYGEQEKNTKLLVLNTAASKLSETKAAENALGKTFSRGEKQLFVANLTAESVLKEQQKNTTSDDVKETIQVKLDNLKAQQKQIFSGDVRVLNDGTIETGKNKPAAAKTAIAAPLVAAQEDTAQPGKEELQVVADLKPTKNLTQIEIDGANKNPTELFKMVADQAQGFNTAADGVRTPVTVGGAQEKQAREKYGDAVVDKAMELYPVPVKAEENVAPAVQQTQFVPAPLKTSLTIQEAKDALATLKPKEQAEWYKAGKSQETLLKIANDKIAAKNNVDKSNFVPKDISSSNNTQNENVKSSQAINEKDGSQQGGQENGQNANEQNVQSQVQEVKNGTTVDNAVVSFNPKESQYEALDRLTAGIKDLPVAEQKAEIEKRAAAHEKSYQEFTKGENKISESNSKAERVSEFGKLTANAMQKFLKEPAGFQADSGDFANGKRKDENGVSISENDFVTLKEKVKELRKQKNTKEIDKINAAPRAYLDSLVKTDWNKLSMQEKLALAKENLPEVEKMSDLDAVKVADQNAKQLLQKLNNSKNENAKENTNGKVVLEGVQQTGNENQGGQDSEQLRKEEKVAAAVESMDLNFIKEKNLPKVSKVAKNKDGVVVGKKPVPNPELVKQQKSIKEKLDNLKKFVECLTT